MTHSRSNRRPPHRIRPNHVIPPQLPTPPRNGSSLHRSSYVPVMTRHRTRKHVPRPSHAYSTKRPTVWDGPIHYIRSILLPRIFLGILPLQPSPNPRIRRTMTPSWNQTPRSNRRPPPKHCHPTSLRGYGYMSSPQHHRSQPKTSNPSTHPNSTPRILFHCSTSHRILRGPILYCRRSVRFHLLCCNRIPWTTRNHWLYIPTSMPPTTG